MDGLGVVSRIKREPAAGFYLRNYGEIDFSVFLGWGGLCLNAQIDRQELSF